MSTYWGFHCTDCDDVSPRWWNHGDDELAKLLLHWPIIKPVYDLTMSGEIWRLSGIVLAGVYDEPGPLEFLNQHNGHTIRVRNEYGVYREDYYDKQV